MIGRLPSTGRPNLPSRTRFPPALPATSQPYVEALETHRYDAGAVGQFLVKQRYVVTGRAAVARQAHSHQFGEDLERDRHDTVFGELAVRGTAAGQPWVVGVAIERDAYMRGHRSRAATSTAGCGSSSDAGR